MTVPLDTTPEVAALQREIQERMGGPARELAMARLRRDHPELPQREIVKLYLRRFFRPGEELPAALR